MGKMDRILRVFGALILLVAVIWAYFIAEIFFMVIFLLIALMLLITAALGYCPLYVPFGISTCKPSAPSNKH